MCGKGMPLLACSRVDILACMDACACDNRGSNLPKHLQWPCAEALDVCAYVSLPVCFTDAGVNATQNVYAFGAAQAAAPQGGFNFGSDANAGMGGGQPFNFQ